MAGRSSFKHRYTRALLDSYFPFIGYVGIFLALFIFAALTIRVDVIQAYHCQVKTDEGKTYVIVDKKVEDGFNQMYAYTQRNVKVYKVNKIALKYSDHSTYIQVENNKEFERFVSGSNNKPIRVEIPQGSVSLLQKMIPLGEVSK